MIAVRADNWMEDLRLRPARTARLRAMRALGAALLLAAGLSTVAARAQQSVSSGGGQVSGSAARRTVQTADQSLVADTGSPIFKERRLRQLTLAQHKAMVSDTDKLLKLVTELNAEIGASNPAVLTADQLRKVAEIEKLARSVKDKMRISAQGSLDFLDATPPIPPNTSRR